MFCLSSKMKSIFIFKHLYIILIPAFQVCKSCRTRTNLPKYIVKGFFSQLYINIFYCQLMKMLCHQLVTNFIYLFEGQLCLFPFIDVCQTVSIIKLVINKYFIILCLNVNKWLQLKVAPIHACKYCALNTVCHTSCCGCTYLFSKVR